METNNVECRYLSDPIQAFIRNFAAAFKDQNVKLIERFYEHEFPKLTELYFKKITWPPVSTITEVESDPMFLILYKELYYRHMYAHVSKVFTLKDGMSSYQNYCDLFDAILKVDEPIDMVLPETWLWDIIDEFIYQYQSFSNYKSKASRLELIEESESSEKKAWTINGVLNVLYLFVSKSKITEQMQACAENVDKEKLLKVAGNFGRCNLYKKLGYFSLIGLSRLHCQLGDYYQSLKVLDKININQPELYTQVKTCHITTLYYIGFSYMMMRRYQDAIRTLSNNILYVNKVKNQSILKPDTQEYVNKQVDKMYMLLSICLTFHPMRIDNTISQHLKDKFQDRMNRLDKFEMNEFDKCFNYSCPKFVNPCATTVTGSGGLVDGSLVYRGHENQSFVFHEEIAQMKRIPKLRSFLKLYTTLDINKLADFLDMSVEALHVDLMRFKHKLANVTCQASTSCLDGELQSGSDTDFYIDGDMIHIYDANVLCNFTESFIKQIEGLQELNLELDNIPVSSSSPNV